MLISQAMDTALREATSEAIIFEIILYRSDFLSWFSLSKLLLNS